MKNKIFILKNTLVSFWKISFSLKDNLLDKVLLFIKFVFCFVFWKIVKNKIFKFNFIYKNKKFVFHADSRVDLAALYEIFVKEEYVFDYKISDSQNTEVILDLGANIGDTAIFYSILFPEAKIFAIEPNPNVLEKLEKNAKQFPNIKICKCAISDTTGKINLDFGDSHLGSSINTREQNTNSVEVDVYNLRDFCEKEKIDRVDILKFDIEGAEEYLLKSDFIKTNVVQFVGEMHDDLVTTLIQPMLDSLNLKDTKKVILNKNRYILYGKL